MVKEKAFGKQGREKEFLTNARKAAMESPWLTWCASGWKQGKRMTEGKLPKPGQWGRKERRDTGTEAVGEAFIPMTCDRQTQKTSAVYKVSQ